VNLSRQRLLVPQASLPPAIVQVTRLLFEFACMGVSFKDVNVLCWEALCFLCFQIPKITARMSDHIMISPSLSFARNQKLPIVHYSRSNNLPETAGADRILICYIQLPTTVAFMVFFRSPPWKRCHVLLSSVVSDRCSVVAEMPRDPLGWHRCRSRPSSILRHSIVIEFVSRRRS
jgi:hypothetical protein